MKRAVVRRLISFWADIDGPLPRWIQRMIDNDPELARFQENQDRILEQLRSQPATFGPLSDPAVRDAEPVVTEFRSIRGGKAHSNASGLSRFRFAMAATSLAVSILICAWGWQLLNSDPDPAITTIAGGTVRSAPRKMDLKPLLAAANAGERVCTQVVDGTQRWLARLRDVPTVLPLDDAVGQAAQTATRIQHYSRQHSIAVHDMGAVFKVLHQHESGGASRAQE